MDNTTGASSELRFPTPPAGARAAPPRQSPALHPWAAVGLSKRGGGSRGSSKHTSRKSQGLHPASKERSKTKCEGWSSARNKSPQSLAFSNSWPKQKAPTFCCLVFGSLPFPIQRSFHHGAAEHRRGFCRLRRRLWRSSWRPAAPAHAYDSTPKSPNGRYMGRQ